MTQLPLRVRVEVAFRHEPEKRVLVARFLHLGDAWLYVKEKQQRPGDLWAAYVQDGTTCTPVYFGNGR